MPFVNVRTVKGIMSAEQKRLLLERITDLMVEIEGRGNPEFRKGVWVMIEEQEPEHWSLGGAQLTREVIERMYGPVSQ